VNTAVVAAPGDNTAVATATDSATPTAAPRTLAGRPPEDSGSDLPSAAASAASTSAASHEAGRWRTDLSSAIESLKVEIEATTDSEQRMRLEGTLRLLYAAANRRDDAIQPIADLDSDLQQYWTLSIASFVEMLDPEGPPVIGRRAKLALRHLREAVQHLGAASSLDVRNLAVCQRVESFGRYTEFEPYEFTAEQEVILYVEVSNFAVQSIEGGYETELQGTYQILDAAGHRLADYDLMLDKQVCRNIRTDYFLPYRIFLPADLAPGAYKIQVTIEDKKGKKFGQTPAVDFEIK
jgi:hypothetical protein